LETKMSLINKMLNDLEKRDAFLLEDQDNILDGLYSAYDLELSQKRKWYSFSSMYVAIFTAISIAVIAYYLFSNNVVQLQSITDNTSTFQNDSELIKTTTEKEIESSISTGNVITNESNHLLKLDDNLLIKVPLIVSGLPISSSLNRIEDIYFEKNEQGINLVMKMPQEIDYMVYGLSDPNRIVIEINNAEPGFLLEDLQPVEPIAAIRYSINKQNRFKLVLESEQPLNIRKSITGKDDEHNDLVVVMEYHWQDNNLGKNDSDALVDIIVNKQVDEENNIVFKGELVKSPVNQNTNAYAEKLFKQAYAEYKNGDIANSLKKLNMVLNRDSGHVNARSTLALILSKQGHTSLAYSVLNEGLIQYPNQSEWTKMYARLLLNEGKVVQAKELLIKHTPELRTNVEYYALLAAVLQKLDEHNESARIYRDLLQISPLKPIWWMGLGISLESMKRYDDALYAYQKAFKNPSLAQDSRQFLTQRINRLNNILEDESA